jgi:hypothetical protein
MKNFSLLLVTFSMSFMFLEKVPYDRDKKPMPEGEEWNTMIPKALGEFVRVSFQAPRGSTNGNVYYKKGKQSVFVSFIKLADHKELQEYMVAAKSDAMRSTADTRETSNSGDYRYVLYKQNDKVFFAWNRGLYYFEVRVEGDVSVMDEFMTVFPY